MRKSLLSLVTILFFSSANSQVKLGIKAGVAISDRGDLTAFSMIRPLITMPVSVFGIIPLKRSFILQPSFGYYPKGYRYKDITFEDQLGNDLGTGNVNYRYDFLELTAPIQYLLVKKIKLFAGLGPYFAYAVSGKVIYKYKSGQRTNEPRTRPITFGYDKRFDAGYVLLFSTQLKSRWMLSLNYENGVINKSAGNPHHTSSGLTVGYFFK
jgi:hypothetical protein